MRWVGGWVGGCVKKKTKERGRRRRTGIYMHDVLLISMLLLSVCVCVCLPTTHPPTSCPHP